MHRTDPILLISLHPMITKVRISAWSNLKFLRTSWTNRQMMMMKRNDIDSPSRPCCQDFAIGCQGVPIYCPFAFPVCEGDQSLLKDRQKKFSWQMDFCRKNLWEFRTSWQQKQYLNKEMMIRWNLVSNFGNSFNWKIKHLLTLIFRRNAGKKDDCWY